MRRRSLLCVSAIFLLVASAAAQTYTIVYNFPQYIGDTNSPQSVGALAQGRDGFLYGTSPFGGTFTHNNQYGTIFRTTPGGVSTVLHSFNYTDGSQPYGGLTLGTDGDFYGTTSAGGLNFGTIFKISSDGTFTVLHMFNGKDEGIASLGAPIEGLDGNFYGTTNTGSGQVAGTVYKTTPSGNVTVLHTFDGVSGAAPNALVLGADGNFYGTTVVGGDLSCGSQGCGVAYKISYTGAFTLLHNFVLDECKNPQALMQSRDGNFYGTCFLGGANHLGSIYKMTPAGVVTVLHSFANDGLGQQPTATLMEATDGLFYGTASRTTGALSGALFKIDSSGNYALLHNFSYTDGANPATPMLQHTNGTLYGTTVLGGSGTQGCFSCGVVYALNVGLPSTVSLVKRSGRVGDTIEILGNHFTGTTQVAVNGVSASFSVVSDTYMTAVVPAGATTGWVRVRTPGKSFRSSYKLRVLP